MNFLLFDVKLKMLSILYCIENCIEIYL